MAVTTQGQDRKPVRIRLLKNKSYDGKEIGPAYGTAVVEVEGLWARRWIGNGSAVPYDAAAEAEAEAEEKKAKAEAEEKGKGGKK